jgi:protein O-mannosyl-transferase
LALYLAAASTKEHTVTLPALLLLTDYFWNPGFSFQGIRRNWRLYGSLAVAGTAGAALLLSVLRGSLSAGFGLKELPWYDYFYTQCRALWVYFRLFVLPFGQNADYSYPISHGVLEPGVILGLAGLLLVAGCAVYYRKRWPVASYGFLGALILFAPTSSVVPILDAVAERRLYLPMAALVLVVVEFMRAWRVRRTVLAGAAVATLPVLGVLCHQRNRVWADDIALWEDTLAKAPWNARAHFQLGVAYYQKGRYDAAAQHYETAFRLGKPDERLLMDWALAEDRLNRPEQALDKLRQAAAIRPTAEVYANTGMILGKQTQYAEALAALNKALEIDPRFEMAYFLRGNVYSELGNYAKAAEDYQRTVAINPLNDAARRGLARLRSR